MNGSKENRYHKGYEKLSKKLKSLYPCANCGESLYDKLETHHIDFDKKNNKVSNLVVLCLKCHKKIHKGELNIEFPKYELSGFSVTAACCTSSTKDWFDSRHPLKLLPYLPPKTANDFRKRHIKGFVTIGGCNFYIGLHHKKLIGVLGFSNPDYGKYDIILKADTTPSELEYSTDLLLYALRTKEVKRLLEIKFNRKINTAYSMCFSQHKQINRYRKHAKKIQEKEKVGGYDLGYLFELGTIPSMKAAKSEFCQKHKI